MGKIEHFFEMKKQKNSFINFAHFEIYKWLFHFEILPISKFSGTRSRIFRKMENFMKRSNEKWKIHEIFFKNQHERSNEKWKFMKFSSRTNMKEVTKHFLKGQNVVFLMENGFFGGFFFRSKFRTSYNYFFELEVYLKFEKIIITEFFSSKFRTGRKPKKKVWCQSELPLFF